MRTNYDVIVVGGGIVGMSCAYELSTRGVKVAVIDKGEIGHGCSYGNAGWITPCFAMPLPKPGMLLKSISWLLDPVGPLYIKPEPRVRLARWLLRFLMSMNQSHLQRSVAALTELSKFSIDAYARLDALEPGAFGFDRKGLLMIAQTDSGMVDALQELELMRPHGIPGNVMTEEECRAFEPAVTGRVKGAVYFPNEAHAEPLAAVKKFASLCVKNGGTVLPNTEAYKFKTSGNKVVAVQTTRGELTADQFVLATGSWSMSIADSLNLNVPVMGGKGYAFIVKPFHPSPRVPIMCLDRKIAVTPRQDSVRIAGTLELVDQDESITARRVDAIMNGARQFMNVPENPEVIELWRGLRPCTPDGVPIIGRSPRYSNFMLSTGHQMLGLQSAPGSARLTADIVTGAKPTFDPHPFRAERF